MNLKETFNKQGGTKLLKQYWKSGALFTAGMEFLLLGKDKTALEILRLSAQLKTKQKLEKKYKGILDSFVWNEEHTDDIPRKVWVCWYQGMENAPAVVQNCYASLQNHIKDREIVLITEENLYDYISFPEYIQEKVDKGVIKGAHLSDLIRLELLRKYGGTWIDSTVFCANDEIPSYMLDDDLFLFQNLKPGRDGNASVISNWFMTARPNHKMICAVQHLLYAYWKEHDELLNYFIFHLFFQMVIEKYPEEWNQVVPFSNSPSHILLLRLFEPYDEKIWNAVVNQVPFHKLSYRFAKEDQDKEGTYYQKIVSSLQEGI